MRLIGVSLSLAFGIVGARLIGAEAFGTYVSLMAIVGFLSVATAFGLPTLITRELASARGSGSYEGLTPLAQICGVLVLLSAIAIAASLLLGDMEITLIFGTALAANLATILAGANSGHERVLFATWMNTVLRPLVALLALVLIAYMMRPSYETALFAQLLGAAAAALALIMAWKSCEIGAVVTTTLTSRWWSPRHPSVVRMGIIFAGGQLLINATTQVDILILTALSSPESIAHYYAAARAALVVSFFFGSSAALAEPKLARLYAAGQMDEFRSVLWSTALVGFAMTVVCAVTALVVAPYYFALYGPSFHEGLPSLVVLVGGLIGWSVFGPAQVGLRAVRQEKKVVLATAIALAVNCAISLTLIPFVGIIGAAIGTGAQFFIYGGTMAFMMYRASSIRSDIFHLAVFKPAAADQSSLDRSTSVSGSVK